MPEKMKIHILYKFRDAAWGGANQFLAGLRKYFRKKRCYSEDLEGADAIIFVSYPFNSEYFFDQLKDLKGRRDVITVNRMNGPISLYRGSDRIVDRMNFMFDRDISDGTIFQSGWSQMKCHEMGMEVNENETVIGNAPDPEIFYPRSYSDISKDGSKIKLAASSWSDNVNKGFDVYSYLDRNLDFTKYDMTFIGNSPVEFKNIRHIPALLPLELAEELRKHDIFVFASKQESCSNSLLEAVHCGLPVVVRNNSSQPELLKSDGVFFDSSLDVIAAIERLSGDIAHHMGASKMQSIEDVGKSYYDFCESIYIKAQQGKYNAKQWKEGKYVALRLMTFLRKLVNTFKTMIKGPHA
jgi:glycosyltransferase involved in cell wall biosynthesis